MQLTNTRAGERLACARAGTTVFPSSGCRNASVLALLILIASPAAAADTGWYTGARGQDPTSDWIVEAATDLSVDSHGSIFAGVSGTAAPFGTLRESGARVRLDGQAGRYSYDSTRLGAPVRGTKEEGAGLLGYTWVWANATVSAYAGVNVENDALSLRDPGNSVVGTSVGAKAAADLYVRPTPDTMLAATASYSTNHNGYYARVQGGWRIWNTVLAGPEVAVLGDDFFRQWRVGVHVAGLSAGPLKLAASAGYLNDSVQKGGFYTNLNVRAGF